MRAASLSSSASSAARAAAAALVAALLLAARPAHADDGYCDYVQGAAAAESAVLLAPEVFAQLGRIEQVSSSVQPVADPAGLRVLAGVRYRLTGVYEGLATRARAAAECRRHRAYEAVRGATRHRALEARVRVLEGALPEAEQMLAQVGADFEARRANAQDATATRLRVEELRRLAVEARRELGEVSAPGEGAPGSGDGGVAAFLRADEDVERAEAKLRRARAVDLSVRAGVDRYLDGGGGGERSPYFAVVSLGVNVGLLWQGRGNARAAAGRRKLARSGGSGLSPEATAALVEAAARRARDTAALEADLARQLETLARVASDDGRRYRQTVWFELVKVRAERAYHDAYLAALQPLVGP